MENQALIIPLKQLAKDGTVSCPQALALAQSQGVPAIAVGQAADEAGIKIIGCQLGCFGGKKERRHGVF